MSKLQPYQDRVISERIELSMKVHRLHTFIKLPTFADIDPSEQERLQRQLNLMQQLMVVLQERIDFFSTVNAKIEANTLPTGTADVRSALAQEIPLDTIGRIIRTDLHPNLHELAYTSDCIEFWGRFSYEGLALQEIPRSELRKHLLHAVSHLQGEAAEHPSKSGYISVMARKAGS